jgi:hypothetical protein
MTDINTGYSQAPIGARLPRFLTNQAAPVGGNQPSYATDRLSVQPAGGNGVDPAQIQAQLQAPNPADRFRAVVAITNMPPQQAIPLLQMAAQNDNAQVRDLANQALGVMQRMPGATQPATNQPGVQPQQPQPQPQQPYNAGPGYQPTVVPQNTYQPAQVGPLSPDDAAFMVQTLQTEVGLGGAQGLNAIRTLAGIAQQNPAQKEPVFNILLNYMYNAYDSNLPEAIKAVASMNDPRALPYFEFLHRAVDRGQEARAAALQAAQAMRLNQGGQPGAASTQAAGATPEYLRMMELEMKRGGQEANAAFQQIRNALGQDPRAASPAKQEVLRIMLTHVATGYDNLVIPAIQLIGAMGSRDMNALQYLDAIKRNPAHSVETKAAANAAIQQIMAAPR